MQKRELTWIALLLALIGLYFWLFPHRFDKKQMSIHASLRPARQADAAVSLVFFGLNDDFRLTSVKVIPFDGDKFNPLGHPVWHLISDSNSAPTRAFRYGQNIKGMKPAPKDTQADPLEPGMVYRIAVEAGSVTASTDFRAKAPGQ
ncbi:MAG TPA: hypothetical protein VK731_10705 [Candidatus Cybelea sp.]|jgi:hypothetical protein|nr:hypothetical protein [Candidatus Cybelea sp.]